MSHPSADGLGPVTVSLSPRAHLALQHLARSDEAMPELIEQLLCARLTRTWGDQTAFTQPLATLDRLQEALISLPMLGWVSPATGERFNHLALAYDVAEIAEAIRTAEAHERASAEPELGPDLDLAELRAKQAAATQGPWMVVRGRWLQRPESRDLYACGIEQDESVYGVDATAISYATDTGQISPNDAEWIVAAVNAMPHLLRLIAAQQAEIARLGGNEPQQLTPTAPSAAWGVCEEPLAGGQQCGAAVLLSDDPQVINRCPVCGSCAVREPRRQTRLAIVKGKEEYGSSLCDGE